MPTEIKEMDKKEVSKKLKPGVTKPSKAGFVLGTGAVWDDYNPYDYTDRTGYYTKEAYEFYDEVNKQWKTNPFAVLVVEYIVNKVFGNGVHFEGDGAEEMELAFKENRTVDSLKNMLRHAILYGNGYIGLGKKMGKLSQTTPVDTRSIKIYWKTVGGPKDASNFKYEQLSSYTGKAQNTVLNEKYLIDYTIRRDPSERYGESLMRPNIDFLRSLLDIGTDIPAAVKRLAYSPVIVKLDLTGYEEQEEKDAVLEEFSDMYENNLSALTNYIIDQKHEIELLNNGGTGLNLPIMDLIEPLLVVVLSNFGFPVGLFLQEGANKSIVGEQRSDIEDFVNEIKRGIKQEVEMRIVPIHTSKDVDFQFSAPRITDPTLKRRLMMEEFQLGLISKEYYLEQADIVDVGSTFYEEPTGPERKPAWTEVK